MVSPQEINRYWLEELGASGWYRVNTEVDAEIRRRFGAAWAEALAGGYRDWAVSAEGRMAYLILTDQFPRNMFRNDARAFASDYLARDLSKWAIARELETGEAEPQKQFYYLPLMHSEVLDDQEHSVRLFMMRMTTGDNLLHARAHRQVIRDFGRFPYRNEALGRESTKAELAYLEAGGYSWSLNNVDKSGWGSAV